MVKSLHHTTFNVVSLKATTTIHTHTPTHTALDTCDARETARTAPTAVSIPISIHAATARPVATTRPLPVLDSPANPGPHLAPASKPEDGQPLTGEADSAVVGP